MFRIFSKIKFLNGTGGPILDALTPAKEVFLRPDKILVIMAQPNASHDLETMTRAVTTAMTLLSEQAAPVLLDLRHWVSMTDDARGLLQGPKATDFMEAIALLVDSPVSRGLANILIKFNPRAIPIQIFSDEANALDWLITRRCLPMNDQRQRPPGAQVASGRCFNLALENEILFVRCRYQAHVEKEDAEELLTLSDRLRQGRKMPIIIIMHHVASMTRDARRAFAQAKGATRLALVISSGVGVVIGNLYLRIAKPKNVTQLFRNYEEGVAWITHREALLQMSPPPSLSENKTYADLLDVVGSFAARNFSPRAVINYIHPERDQLACAINMLGEELQATLLRAEESEQELELKKQLLQAKEQVFKSAKMAALGTLAAGVAHEINNPLAIAVNFLARAETELHSDQQDAKRILADLTKVQDAHHRIRDIVDAMRTYSRESAHTSSVPVNLGNHIQGTLDLLRTLYASDGLQLVSPGPIADVLILGNPGKLQQIQMNLIQNARDAVIGRLDPRIEISVTANESENSAQFVVKDNGEGMSKETLERIFDPFFTTKEVGKGTGLGLGLVANIVEEMNGHLNVTSTLGEGSTFILTFPMLAKAAPLPVAAAKAGQKFLPKSFKGRRVLVIDDEPDLGEIMTYYLNSIGLVTTYSNNPVEALKLIQQDAFDFVFSDRRMPMMSGEALIRIARVHSPTTKFFLITGDLGTNITTEGVDGVLLKPASLEQIHNMILLHA